MTTPEMSLAAQRLREGGRNSWQQDPIILQQSLSQTLHPVLPPLMPHIRGGAGGADITSSSQQRISNSPARPPSRPLLQWSELQQDEQDCRAVIEKMRNMVHDIVRKEEMAIGESRIKHIKKMNDLHLYKANIDQRKTRLAEIVENNMAMEATQELIYAEMSQMGVAELALANASETVKQRLQAASDWLAMLVAEVQPVIIQENHTERKMPEEQDRRMSLASTPSRGQERTDRLHKQLEGEKMQLKQERDLVRQEKERDLELKKRWEHEMTEEKAKFRREKNDLQMELQKVNQDKEVIKKEKEELNAEILQLRAAMEQMRGEMEKSTACNEGHVSRLRSLDPSGSTLIDSLHLRLLDQLKDAADKNASPKEVLTRQQRALSTGIDIIQESYRKQSSVTEVASSDISLPATSQPAMEEAPTRHTPIPIIHIKKRGRPTNASKQLQREKEREREKERVASLSADDDDAVTKRKRRPKIMSPDEGYDHSNDDDYVPARS